MNINIILSLIAILTIHPNEFVRNLCDRLTELIDNDWSIMNFIMETMESNPDSPLFLTHDGYATMEAITDKIEKTWEITWLLSDFLMDVPDELLDARRELEKVLSFRDKLIVRTENGMRRLEFF